MPFELIYRFKRTRSFTLTSTNSFVNEHFTNWQTQRINEKDILFDKSKTWYNQNTKYFFPPFTTQEDGTMSTWSSHAVQILIIGQLHYYSLSRVGKEEKCFYANGPSHAFLHWDPRRSVTKKAEFYERAIDRMIACLFLLFLERLLLCSSTQGLVLATDRLFADF